MSSFPSGAIKDVDAIIRKLKKLRLKYRNEKTKLNKSGNSRPKKLWQFFDKMDNIYKDSPSINPAFLLDTSKEDQNLDFEDNQLDDEKTKSVESGNESDETDTSPAGSREFGMFIIV